MSVNSPPTILIAWALVVASGVFEIVFSVQMKESDGFRNLFASSVAVAAGVISIWLMTLALRTLPLGEAYAVWAGIGTVGTAVAAGVLYGEVFTPAKIVFIALVVVGIVGLQWQGSE